LTKSHLARCNLNIDHFKFRDQVGNDANLRSGLEQLRDKVAKDHKLSGWFPQPMSGIPEFKDKIWKWQWAPENDHSATRKGWRLMAYVPDPATAEPIPATAFLVYDKGATEVISPKNIAKLLRKFLQAINVDVRPEKMHRRPHGDDNVELICMSCYARLIVASADADLTEDIHECPKNPN